jgi:hypothetical protein
MVRQFILDDNDRPVPFRARWHDLRRGCVARPTAGRRLTEVPRQIDPHGRAHADIAFDMHAPARLLDKSVQHGQAEPGPLALRFGGEEGLERSGRYLGRHTTAAVAHAERDRVRGDAVSRLGRDTPVPVKIFGTHDEATPSGTASCALIARFRIALSS